MSNNPLGSDGTEPLAKQAAEYYTRKIREHGPTASGADWKSVESQYLRFEQLLKVCDTSGAFSILDFGCGYGALADYLEGRGLTYSYCGYDVSEEMLKHAQEQHRDLEHCRFIGDKTQLVAAEYTIASGIFNVKLDTPETDWKEYVRRTVHQIADLSARGFAFNVLTLYSDVERRRADLYYADPLFWFDYCKRNFSKYVALLHDYPLYEFTILVRK